MTASLIADVGQSTIVGRETKVAQIIGGGITLSYSF